MQNTNSAACCDTIQDMAPVLPPPRPVAMDQAVRWLDLGLDDFIAHPEVGLVWGGVCAASGWLMCFGLIQAQMGSLILPVAAGFLLVAPVLAVGLYDVSRRRDHGCPVSLGHALRAMGRNRHLADMGLLLVLVLLVWLQVAMGVFALFYGGQPPSLDAFFAQILAAPQAVPFLLVGSVAGGALAALVFAACVVAMPMLVDQPVSAATAIRTSMRVVWLNRLNMIGWAATLASLAVLGMLLLFVGLAVTLPVAGHASWHAYRDLTGRVLKP